MNLDVPYEERLKISLVTKGYVLTTVNLYNYF